jgi:hypothetical protein
MSAMRRGTLLTVVLLSTVLPVSVASATRTVTLGSHISIRGQGLRFSGRVTSSNSGCEVARHVALYTTSGQRLGSARTGRAGRWTITASGYAGISLAHFYARVSRRSEGTAGTIYVCRGARSATIPFHQ